MEQRIYTGVASTSQPWTCIGAMSLPGFVAPVFQPARLADWKVGVTLKLGFIVVSSGPMFSGETRANNFKSYGRVFDGHLLSSFGLLESLRAETNRPHLEIADRSAAVDRHRRAVCDREREVVFGDCSPASENFPPARHHLRFQGELRQSQSHFGKIFSWAGLGGGSGSFGKGSRGLWDSSADRCSHGSAGCRRGGSRRCAANSCFSLSPDGFDPSSGAHGENCESEEGPVPVAGRNGASREESGRSRREKNPGD